MNKKISLLKLFISCLTISCCTFGGGFVVVTFMKKKFVDEYHYLSEEKMLDIIAIAQSSPGSIAVNAAILVGWNIAGIFGMLLAVLGTIIPPIAIICLVAFLYEKFVNNVYVSELLNGMQAGVAAVLTNVVIDMSVKTIKSKKMISIVGMILAFIMTYFLKISVMIIIFIAVLVGISINLIKRMKK